MWHLKCSRFYHLNVNKVPTLTWEVKLLNHHAQRGLMRHCKYRVFESQLCKSKVKVSLWVDGVLLLRLFYTVIPAQWEAVSKEERTMRVRMHPNDSILIKCLFRTLGLQGKSIFIWLEASKAHGVCIYCMCVYVYVFFLLNLFEAAVL